MATPARRPVRIPAPRLKKEAGLKKIAALLEAHMTEQGMSEEEKDARVAAFSKRVNRLAEGRAKP